MCRNPNANPNMCKRVKHRCIVHNNEFLDVVELCREMETQGECATKGRDEVKKVRRIGLCGECVDMITSECANMSKNLNAHRSMIVSSIVGRVDAQDRGREHGRSVRRRVSAGLVKDPKWHTTGHCVARWLKGESTNRFAVGTSARTRS